MKKGVEIIDDPERAKVMTDPMRREILRLLSGKAMTENELAKTLGLSEASVGHHLKILKESGLIKMVRQEAEEHGILQKFYGTIAHAFFIDCRKMPLEIERYFMPGNVERARAVIATLIFLSHRSNHVSAEDIEEFARILASTVVDIGSKYIKPWEGDGEQAVNRIHQEALSYLQSKPSLLPENVRNLLRGAQANGPPKKRLQYADSL